MFEALKAAVEERMRLAREATPGPWEAAREDEYMPWRLHEIERFREYRNHVFLGEDEPTARHIAANDPAFVLRQCERDLDLIRRYTEEAAESEGRMTRDEIWEHYARLELLRGLIRELAEVYQINLGVSDDS